MIITLSTAFALVEEGLTTQSLFNPDYADADLLEPAAIPVLGIGGWWTIFVVVLHVVSLGVSIALIEALVPERADVAWLGGRGLGIAIGLFVVGAVLTTAITLAEDPYVAAPAQLLGVAVAVILLAMGALRRNWHPSRPKSVSVLLDRDAPDTRLRQGRGHLRRADRGVPRLDHRARGGTLGGAGARGGGSRRAGDRAPAVVTPSRLVAPAVLAAATGAATAYACFGLVTPPVVDSDPVADLVGNALVAGAVLWLCLLARRRCAVHADLRRLVDA